ncbi:MAG TPA: hypothetical protein VGB74_10825 [Actinoplanes sp.]
MKVVTLAAGLAVGYVLGSRAGREKYEQIVATVRKVTGEPVAVPAPHSSKELPAARVAATPAAAETPVPRPPRRKHTNAHAR